MVVGLQVPAGQQFAAERTTDYLATKLNTRVSIGRFTTDWNNSLVLKEFYLEDRNRDTLIYARHFGVNLNLVALLQNRLRVRSARLEDCLVNLYTTPPDSAFNYQFILEAFSSKKASGSGSFFYRVGAVNLRNCRLRLTDPVGGTFLNAHVGTFDADLGNFTSKDPVYDLGKLKLENSFGQYIRTKEKPAGKNSNPTRLEFDELKLKNISLNYQHKPAGNRFYLLVGKGEVNARDTNLRTGLIDLKTVDLTKTNFAWYRDKIEDPGNNTAGNATKERSRIAPEKVKKMPVQLTVGELKIKDSGYIFSDLNHPVKGKGFDLKHLKITNIATQIKKIEVRPGKVAADIKRLTLHDKSGLDLKKLTGKLNAGKTAFQLSKLEIKTRASHLKGDILLKFPGLSAFKENRRAINFNLDLNRLSISWKELFQVLPALAENKLMQKVSGQPLELSGRFSGNPEAIKLAKLKLKNGSGTSLSANGSVYNATSEKPLDLDLEVKELALSRSDLNRLTAGSQKLNWPDKVSLSGNFRGNLARLNFQKLRLLAGGTEIRANGTVQGVNLIKKHLDLQVTSLETGRDALLALLPPGTVSPEINLPKRIHYEGTFQGTSVQDFVTHARFQTSYGYVQTDLTVTPGQQFSGFIMVKDFNAGKLLKQDKNLGKATGDANFKGQGFKIKTMNLQFDARIKKIAYKKEIYRNIKLDGTLNKNVYDMNGNLKNVVLQELGHKLKVVKKANPLKVPGKIKRKLGFGKKKKKKEEPVVEEEE